MPRVLSLLICALCALCLPDRAPADSLLFAPFDPAPLDAAETGLLHAALAARGEFAGPLDAAWDADSERALAAYVLREFSGAPRNLHAAALVADFLGEIEARGWRYGTLPDLGMAMALPERALTASEPEATGRRWWSDTGSLTLLAHRFGADEALAWHEAAVAANTEPAALEDLRGADVLITAGRLADGRAFFTRSDRLAGHWATVFLASGPDEAALMTLMRASLRPGPPLAWQLPPGGRLEALLDGALRLADSLDPARGGRPAPDALRLGDAPALAASGTGFFVSERVLVTAQHVVQSCRAIGLADGTVLRVIAADPELDVAALTVPGPSPDWLSLLPAAPARLGQEVHAMGFPYYAIAGTSLHLTGGNVSALAGVDDDRRFFSFTAPVQPGSSGGPLIGPRGEVLGLVVSRLSESYIAETTGTLPQNVNYALSNAELLAFLARSGVKPAARAAPAYDLDTEGVPAALAAAVVPVLCL